MNKSFVVPRNRLGRQVYSPKIRVILPLYACHSDQVILEWLAVLLTVNLIKTLNLSKLKRRLVMWGPAYRFELRINSVAVRPLNSTWYWGLAAYEGLVFSWFAFALNIFWVHLVYRIDIWFKIGSGHVALILMIHIWIYPEFLITRPSFGW